MITILLSGGPGNGRRVTYPDAAPPETLEWAQQSATVLYTHSRTGGGVHVYVPARLVDRVGPAPAGKAGGRAGRAGGRAGRAR